MRAVIQCVRKADVSVDGGEPRAIGPGIVVLLGFVLVNMAEIMAS